MTAGWQKRDDLVTGDCVFEQGGINLAQVNLSRDPYPLYAGHGFCVCTFQNESDLCDLSVYDDQYPIVSRYKAHHVQWFLLSGLYS